MDAVRVFGDTGRQPGADQALRAIRFEQGGRGAVRRVCEFILESQGKLDAALAPFLPEAAQ